MKVDSFEKFFNSKHEQAEFSRESIYRGIGIELSEVQWNNLKNFPVLFEDKLFIKQVHLNKKYINSNKIFFKKLVSLIAACMGYGKSRGYKFPKTKIIVSRLRANQVEAGAGYHAHYGKRSWSHEIDVILDNIQPDIENLVKTISHELTHSLQISMRRMHTPIVGEDDPYNIKWDKDWYKIIHPDTDAEQYAEQPWEKQAVEKSNDAIKYVLQYLRSGVTTGFNPKSV